jgi:hypothetical protein
MQLNHLLEVDDSVINKSDNILSLEKHSDAYGE